MKARILGYWLLLAATVTTSCKKNDAPPGEQQKTGDIVVKIRQGLIAGDDTVHLFKYDSARRITSIADSTRDWELVPIYNSTGQLESVISKYNGEVSDKTYYSFNENNQLTEISVLSGVHPYRYVFEYTNGVISKKTYYIQTNSNNPALNVWRYHTYTVTDGNITGMKEYSALDDLLSEKTFTYTGEPNVFKFVSLLNAMNILGLEEIANHETHFNKNLIASSVSSDRETQYPYTYTYTYNGNKLLDKVVVNTPFSTYTRTLFY